MKDPNDKNKNNLNHVDSVNKTYARNQKNILVWYYAAIYIHEYTAQNLW